MFCTERAWKGKSWGYILSGVCWANRAESWFTPFLGRLTIEWWAGPWRVLNVYIQDAVWSGTGPAEGNGDENSMISVLVLHSCDKAERAISWTGSLSSPGTTDCFHGTFCKSLMFRLCTKASCGNTFVFVFRRAGGTKLLLVSEGTQKQVLLLVWHDLLFILLIKSCLPDIYYLSQSCFNFCPLLPYLIEDGRGRKPVSKVWSCRRPDCGQIKKMRDHPERQRCIRGTWWSQHC